MTGTFAVPRRATSRNDVSVRIDAEVYRLAKLIASWEGVDLAEYLSKSMKPIVERDWVKVQKDVSKRPTPD